jgi:tetratricopeptide (TPR) repeat protein
MADSIPNRKAKAGWTLVIACEEALGVQGPTALARVTGHSQGCWSKLRNGQWGARFPDWEEVEAILPSDVPAEALERLHTRYLEALLHLRDPDQLAHLRAPVSRDFDRTQLNAVRDLARKSFTRGDHAAALPALQLLEKLLAPVDELSQHDLETLADCLSDQSVCEGRLGNHEAAIQAAERAAAVQQRAGSAAGEAGSIHQLGLACHHARRFEDALRHFASARQAYEALGMRGEAVRARRDRVSTLLALGRLDEAEREINAALIETQKLEPRYRFPTLLKRVDVALARGDAGEARKWLIRANDFARRHAEELADHLERHHTQESRARLERAVAELEAGGHSQV